MSRAAALPLVLLIAMHASAASADWKKLLEQTLGGGDGAASAAASAALSNDDVVAGLKEALAKGAESAVGALGRPDGFLANSAVKIPLPESMQPVAKVLRTFGQQRYTDEFVQTMNRAAESAVPEAGAILGDAIRQMSVEDAKSILNGPDDAATRYFRQVGEERLTARLRPVVSDATSRAGVTSAFKQVVDQAGPAASLVESDAMDIDGYVTGKALDGLFLMIAAEEKRIRENPAARSTELLQKVFGAAR
jgi:hypothetical protein